MSEQVPFEQHQGGEDTLSLSSASFDSNNVDDSNGEGSWNVVQGSDNSSENEYLSEKEREDEHSHPIEEGKEQDQLEENSDESAEYDPKYSKCSAVDDSDQSSCFSPICSTTSSATTSVSEKQEESSNIRAEVNPHLDANNIIPALPSTVSNASGTPVCTSSHKSETTSHSVSAISMQAVQGSQGSCTTASETAAGSESRDKHAECDILTEIEAGKLVLEELYLKIKAATKPTEKVSTLPSPPPQQEEDKAAKFWNEVGQKQFNALMAAHVQAELKQKVVKALESDVKIAKEVSVEQVQKPLETTQNAYLFPQKPQKFPLVEAGKQEDVVGKRFCLVCSIGRVCVVPVNAGRNHRWQCIDCKEWYKWCPVVHPVSAKRARLLETGGWDTDEDFKQEEQAANKAKQEDFKPVVEDNKAEVEPVAQNNLSEANQHLGNINQAVDAEDPSSVANFFLCIFVMVFAIYSGLWLGDVLASFFVE